MKATSYPLLLVVALIVLPATYFAGRLSATKNTDAVLEDVHSLRTIDPQYHFISPLLACEQPESAEPADVILRQKLEKVINGEIANGNISSVSLYVKDLVRSRWVGINEDERYSPASMLKVVVMIAYFKLAEERSGILDQPLLYTKEFDDANNALPDHSPTALSVGRQYSTESLMARMITDSDNGALNTLLGHLKVDELASIYRDLGVPSPTDGTLEGEYTISPKEYGRFFRVLYNGTYLSQKYSEQALELLSRAKYDRGLVAGLPGGTKVAHKFGEHVNTTTSDSTTVDLHDCGIVYAPGHPYFICVMTAGKQISVLEGVIQELNTLIYGELEQTSSGQAK